MEYLSEKDERKLAYFFKRYSPGLHAAVKERLNKMFHDNAGNHVPLVYMCPLCLKNKISVFEETTRSDDEFDVDHFPPKSAGGTESVFVCKTCNSSAGHEFDYSIKLWLKYQGFAAGVPNTKIPATVKLEDVKGNYKGNLVMGEGKKWALDEYERYPLLKERMEAMLGGKDVISSWRFEEPDLKIVSRAILKAAYLNCFSAWGYDFAYTATGHRLRQIIIGAEVHPLSNSGIFYHMDDRLPPDGICLVLEPKHLQSFMVNLKLTDKDTGYQCGVSVLIPSGYNEWEQIQNYQSVITQPNFEHKAIKVPEKSLTDENVFPFTCFWENRMNIKIHEQPATGSVRGL
jgi:hypothetical protein